MEFIVNIKIGKHQIKVHFLEESKKWFAIPCYNNIIFDSSPPQQNGFSKKDHLSQQHMLN